MGQFEFDGSQYGSGKLFHLLGKYVIQDALVSQLPLEEFGAL